VSRASKAKRKTKHHLNALLFENEKVLGPSTIYSCGRINCSWAGTRQHMIFDKDFTMPGELEPAGRCPKCGAMIDVADDDVPNTIIERCIRIAKKRKMIRF
jgi:hypothetical protein